MIDDIGCSSFPARLMEQAERLADEARARHSMLRMLLDACSGGEQCHGVGSRIQWSICRVWRALQAGKNGGWIWSDGLIQIQKNAAELLPFRLRVPRVCDATCLADEARPGH